MTNSTVSIKKNRLQAQQNNFNFTAEMLPKVHSVAVREKMHDAWNIYAGMPFPGDRDEAWRRTSLEKLDKHAILNNFDQQRSISIPDRFINPVIEGKHAGKLTIHPGGSSQSLNHEYAQAGAIFDDFAKVVEAQPRLIISKMGQLVQASDGKFSALASAFAHHGSFLYVPKGLKIAEPLHALFWNDGKDSSAFSHHIVWLEDGAEATFVQEYASDNERFETQFHSGILEVFVGEHASLKLVELQSWGRGTWNIMHENVKVAKDGHLSWIFGSLGSHLTKSFSSVDLAGEGANAKISGFYFADEDQHLDMDTEQNHLAPNTTSDLLYKGAVTERARSVWQGNIYVAPGANGTDGYQANRNLILSSKARADSIPGLEILADDVKCTHGATVGKVDPEQVFYLRSRGLNENDARHLIVEGFFEPIMERIPFQAVQERFRSAIIDKIDTN
ncbi:MAG: Fe-S cluster assembly protein SufD [Anaerolinea sp.]|nr:Fe-S cluster assembly protein SufD [Anaerolinea sp.]